jgi:tetratricopeptide (TPR) repeat protein
MSMLRSVVIGIAAAVAASSAIIVCAHDDEPGTGKLGKVTFKSSCDPKVQDDLERAVAMLHSFWYSAGEQAFRDVLARDPSCAVANFGIAAILMSNPLAGMGASPAGAQKAQAAIDLGRKTGAKTERERDYIEAVAAYYQDFANRPERARQESRAKAFEALAAKYPDDDEAQIFSALYIAATQQQSDQTYGAYLKSAGILEKQFAKHPDHPGVAHYLIHSYDAPPIAKQGITAARRYAGIAPAAPHALHMPSHIFTRVGEWEASVATNRRSAEVAVKGNEPDEAFHASDYAVYANLQMARDGEALKDFEAVSKVTGESPARSTAPYARAAMAARLALERGAWKDAMQLSAPAVTSKFPYTDAITYFARALGAARTGDIAAAERDAAQLGVLHYALVEAKDRYWATEVEVQRTIASAWIALAKQDSAEALRLMRAAADMEDRNEKHIITPGRVLPARELLGDMLLEMKQPADALKEYEASQAREPNRFRGLYGAARAAEQSGDRARAADYYARLLALAKSADSNRPELSAAKTFIASR